MATPRSMFTSEYISISLLQVAEQEQVPPPPPAEPPRPGFIATVFVFVTAFFTSLIPQQRQELQMN